MKRAAHQPRDWREAIPNDRLAHVVKEAWRSLVRALQSRLGAHDIPFGYWTFLRVLWETDGLTQRELSDRVGVMEPTTFTALKTMQRLGYVTRRQLPGNRKKIFVHLTPKGRALKSRLVPLAEDVNRIAVRGLKPTEVTAARRVLLAIIDNLAGGDTDYPPKRRRKPAREAKR